VFHFSSNVLLVLSNQVIFIMHSLICVLPLSYYDTCLTK
jgi:hypothetical protein